MVAIIGSRRKPCATRMHIRGPAMKLSAIVIAASLLGVLAARAQDAPSPEHLAARQVIIPRVP
jgi:hypothetical protein